jgi:Tol biopolymer transport system component
MAEIKDRHDFPDETRLFSGDVERGIRQPDSGWLLQGFIEDASGALRPQTFEETAYCMGCHGGGLGATTDSMFAFARKVGSDSHRRGWYHWSQKSMAGLNEPKVETAGAGVYYEYAYFLMYTKSGNEFLANPELHDAFFQADDTPRLDRFSELHDDVTLALVPSAARALALNKTYRTLVEEQSFAAGRDVLLAPATRVLRDVADGETTGVAQATALGPLSGCYGPTCEADRTSSVLTDFEQSVLGAGMDGPDGQSYEVDWQGLIHKSRYANVLAGVSFTFPRRLTLPTREIVALRDSPSCYTCHRIHAPIVDAQRKTTLEPGIPPVASAPAERATPTQLTSDPGHDTGPRFSPDGKTIAFVSDRTGTDQVWLMNADGTNQRALTQGPAKHAWPEWHPDGSRLVVWGYDSGQQSIAIVPVDGTPGPILVTSSEALDRPVYRPDGLSIAYGATTASNWDVWIIGADGTQQHRLTTDPAMESNPLWRPDGKALAYKVAPSGRYGLTIENFLTFEKGLADPTVHTWNGPQAIQMNGWSPDGTQAAYTAEVISGASGADRVSYANVVSTLDLSGPEAVATTSVVLSQGQTLGDRSAVFSPDGKRVAFWAWDKRLRATLWLADLGSQQVQQVTTLGLDMVPQWSPDGTKLVFESSRGGNTDLWFVRPPAQGH